MTEMDISVCHRS